MLNGAIARLEIVHDYPWITLGQETQKDLRWEYFKYRFHQCNVSKMVA